MQGKKKRKAEISLTLFIDNNEDSRKAKEALETISEPCNFYNVQTLQIANGDEIDAPLLYAPEGVFRGWRQIQTFLNIPPEMRYKSLVDRT